MSTAATVPETAGRRDDEAWSTLTGAGHRLLIDAFLRMRVADGFSHARSLAFMTTLVAMQGMVAIIGLASAVGREGVGLAAERITGRAAPGPVGDALLTAIAEGNENAGADRYIAIAVGLAGALVAGTTAMGQLQRSLNRLYGVEGDRPAFAKYWRGFVLALSAGALLTIAFGAIAFGSQAGASIEDNVLTPVWGAIRVPLALVALAVAMALLLKVCPARRQPTWPWLAPGAAVGVAGWALVTLALGAVLDASSSFGEAYGALAGVVALLLWALLSSIALLYGAAVAAQLEAVRAGAPAPQDSGRERPGLDDNHILAT